MKNLNQNASKIAAKLFELLIAAGDHLVINNNGENSGLMAVSLERRPPIVFKFNDSTKTREVFSVAHYYEQNGDLMSDPYMEFIVSDDLPGEEKLIIPIVFRQDGLFAKDDTAIDLDDDGNFKGYYPRLQKDITIFANMWMKNISSQQNLAKMTVEHASKSVEAKRETAA